MLRVACVQHPEKTFLVYSARLATQVLQVYYCASSVALIAVNFAREQNCLLYECMRAGTVSTD